MATWHGLGGRLHRKYAVYFVALVTLALLASGLSGMYFSHRDNVATLVTLQREKAAAAAYKIEQYVKEIERQVGWTSLPRVVTGPSPLEQRRLDYLRLLRQAPAITEIALIDPSGQERLLVSRLAMDSIESGKDRSRLPAFREAERDRTYFGPVYFRKETEPYMTVAMVDDAGVTVAEVNLKFMWDVVSGIRAGRTGYAYVVGPGGRLISHPDISLVLKKTDLGSLRQVRAALSAGNPVTERPDLHVAENRGGQPVLVAHAPIPSLGWAVLVEQPLTEALAPLYGSMLRTALLLLAGLVLAAGASFVLARRMVEPIRALQAGADRIGAGRLDHRIEVHTGDELEDLATQFNRMADQLRESYAHLERKVEERTEQLARANEAKSRFLAAASHDLRQPMHALGLFVAQLRDTARSPDTLELVEQAQSAVSALRQLLDAILDVSKLDAGVLRPSRTEFAIGSLFDRLRASFAPEFARKGLRLRVAPCRLSVRSDPVLLERILLNLVSNALRYTERGGVLLGCRRSGAQVRIEVWDSGVGIPRDKRREIFREFVQLGNPERDRGKGLGLGLAIVDRLVRLLGHRLELRSEPGRGSVFAVTVERGAAVRTAAPVPAPACASDRLGGALVMIVDDDMLVRAAMTGLLSRWGCHVIVAGGSDEAVERLARSERFPDVIVCDYRLPGTESGIGLVQRLRVLSGLEIPAVIVTGDTAPERLKEALASGFAILHKPVQPERLRDALHILLAGDVTPGAPRAAAPSV
ncbi:ATPase [Sulfurifustis variabilis]|uniref:histidine kinase n=1 Tax=Sulfurifustis variabilis TaxID=1675686 RepID=A0A1C7AFD6_9GAMM|nr:ATP-binding protein [Sulfurifustis variabilis]BAU50012.1 ATPase [Sulfurifustis variabilis]